MLCKYPAVDLIGYSERQNASIMDTLLSLKVFCQVVESGSFTKAADTLDISTAMASKHVTHLEKTVNARLLHRTSRSLSLTNEGEMYHAQCMQALALLDGAEQEISTRTDTPKGHLRIAASIWCATPTFASWLAEYQAMYPQVSVDLVLDNAMTDLASDNFDLALRVNDTLALSLIARPLMTVPFVLVASPEYLGQHGTPTTAKELEEHAFVLPSYLNLNPFSFKYADGRSEILELSTRSQSNNTSMLKSMVAAGMGVGYLPLWLVREDLDAGQLTQLFADDFADEVQLHAIYLSRRHLSAKIRSFIDFLAAKK